MLLETTINMLIYRELRQGPFLVMQSSCTGISWHLIVTRSRGLKSRTGRIPRLDWWSGLPKHQARSIRAQAKSRHCLTNTSITSNTNLAKVRWHRYTLIEKGVVGAPITRGRGIPTSSTMAEHSRYIVINYIRSRSVAFLDLPHHCSPLWL